MRIVYILLLAVVIGAWSFFSPGTLSVAILSIAFIYMFSLSFKNQKQKKIIIGICVFALFLRFILSIFNYYASWAMGVGADFINDARAYSASGQYIAEVITQKPASDFSIYEGTKMTMPAAYSMIKAGIINFTRYLASYYGRYNVRVNCISPGGLYDRQPASFVKRYTQKTPLGRMANRDDIPGAVIYLASDASRYVTGHNLVIDGGRTII